MKLDRSYCEATSGYSYPVMSTQEKEALDMLWGKYGLAWFTCEGSDVSKDQLETMSRRGFLERVKTPDSHTVNFRIAPSLRCD